ncbi:FAD-dependent oxidoreductase [Sphingomonas sp. MMS24-J13]|uniref:FAD-dependent oxidoreductase n=1 Tax=Sphingomonas sp. MMS24-J13 TaxID=3238686 RepID=UPI00384D95F2
MLLHRLGHRVTLFERFAAPQPIGSGLMIQPTGLAVLRALGLGDRLLAGGARIDRLRGETTDPRRIVLDVHYSALRGQAFGIGVHRATLFAILHDAVIAAGLTIEGARAIVGSTIIANGRRRLDFADGRSAGPFDLIVDALGTRSTLAPPTGHALAYGALWGSLDWPDGAGFDGHALEQRYRRASVMAGVLPLGHGKAALFWSLRADRLQGWYDAGLAAWKDEVAALWPATQPLLDQLVASDQLTFARYAHRTLRTPAETGMIHIGDAWHSASPQLGQGANMALLDAYALMRGLKAHDEISSALAAAVKMSRSHIHLYQALTALFTPVYQSDGRMLPFVRDRLVGPLSRLWPATWIQAALVSGTIGNPLGKLGLS